LLALGYGNGLDYRRSDWLARFSAIRYRYLYGSDTLYDVHAFCNPAELSVAGRPVKAGGTRAGADKKLAAARIRHTGVGHGEDAGAVRMLDRQFVGDVVTGPARAGAGRVAALDHESFDDTMKDRAVVESFLRKEYKVIDGLGRFAGQQLDLETAEAGIESGIVFLGGVNLHRGGRGPFFGHSCSSCRGVSFRTAASHNKQRYDKKQP
jgi:hypothetical protein